MKQLDFASVAEVLRNNIQEDYFPNQRDFVETLFLDVTMEEQRFAGGFDEGQTCRWLKGYARLSPYIIGFYRKETNQRKLAANIRKNILPKMPDSAMAIQELYDLVLFSTNVSPSKKMELTDGYTFKDDNDEAVFIAEILCFAMQLPFVKREVQENQIVTSSGVSPAVVGHIYDTKMPRLCRWFVGREQELEQLHELLVEHSKVFLNGIPGIGKSELAKAYVKRHGKEYTNVIYINYPGDLKRAIIDLDFSDDGPEDSDDVRLKLHNRFLNSLLEDTLIIVDNFNATASQDQFLDVMLQYQCRILFTTRSRYENHTSLEIGELSMDDLLKLVCQFYPEAEKRQEEIGQIIELLHGHTFAVELVARLLTKGMLEPGALRAKLQKEKAELDAAEKISTTKDGRNKRATYYEHIHNLFSLYMLSREEQETLRSMTLIPAKGISSVCFAEWMKQTDLNTINDLIEMGFVQPIDVREILLHPMIREIAVVELKPSVRNCEVLLESLQEISLMHGLEFVDNRKVFHTIEVIIKTVKKDDMPRYLCFLKDVFQYMDKYRYESGMRAIIDEMTVILQDDSVGTSIDRACLLDCRVALEKNTKKQIELLQEAIRVLGEVHPDNAHLAANLHANLGALYHQIGRMDLAKLHMEQGVYLLEEYGLTGYHDRVMLINNYATVLTDLGEPQRAYSELLKLARDVQKHNSGQCLDYGLIQQTMGNVCSVNGDTARTLFHYQTAMEIYEMVLENEPALLEQKRQEIGQAALDIWLKNKGLLV